MRFSKILGIAAVVAAAAMALAATASATTLTSPEGTAYTGTLVVQQESAITLHGPADITCEKSTAFGSIIKHGAATTAVGEISSWALTECNQHVKVNKVEDAVFHSIGGGNGELTASGTEVEAEITALGLRCIYTTENTSLGLVTGSANTKGNATAHSTASLIPRTGGSFFCGPSAELEGSYVITTPSTLYVDE